MADPRDLLTQQYDFLLSTTRESRIVDLWPDPGGGYFALIDPATPVSVQLPNPPPLLSKLDGAFSVVWTKTIDIIDTGKPEFTRLRAHVSGMTVGPRGIFVVGDFTGHSSLPRPTAFVAKLGLDGSLAWIKRFSPLLFDGCRAPDGVNAFGRSIVRLEPPDDDRLMLLLYTAHSFDGTGEPTTTDSLSAALVVLDDDGDAHLMTRLFGFGQAIPERLRVLPTLGLTVVGRTRRLVPHVEAWLGWIAKIDRDGLPLRETWIGFGEEAHGRIFDIAEEPRGAVAVGVIEARDFRAFAAGVPNTGIATWIARYDPPSGTEFFQNGLFVVRSAGETIVAAGDYDFSLSHPGELRRPWLLGLTAADPTPIWQKVYPVDPVRLVSGFDCLWIREDEIVLAGGNIARGSGDRYPFLAVSESTPGVGPLVCSETTSAIVTHPPRLSSIITPIYDRMPGALLDIPAASSDWPVEVIRICSDEAPD